MNYYLNNVRAMCTISIMYIHTITFLAVDLEPERLASYFLSMASLVVPLMFMLSGYLFAKSSSQKDRLQKTFSKYIIFILVTAILNKVLFNVDINIYNAFLFNPASIGYMWFVKIIIYICN